MQFGISLKEGNEIMSDNDNAINITKSCYFTNPPSEKKYHGKVRATDIDIILNKKYGEVGIFNIDSISEEFFNQSITNDRTDGALDCNNIPDKFKKNIYKYTYSNIKGDVVSGYLYAEIDYSNPQKNIKAMNLDNLNIYKESAFINSIQAYRNFITVQSITNLPSNQYIYLKDRAKEYVDKTDTMKVETDKSIQNAHMYEGFEGEASIASRAFLSDFFANYAYNNKNDIIEREERERKEKEEKEKKEREEKEKKEREEREKKEREEKEKKEREEKKNREEKERRAVLEDNSDENCKDPQGIRKHCEIKANKGLKFSWVGGLLRNGESRGYGRGWGCRVPEKCTPEQDRTAYGRSLCRLNWKPKYDINCALRKTGNPNDPQAYGW